MQRRRRTEVVGGTVWVPPTTPSLEAGLLLGSSQAPGCTCAGDVFGHERHCGEVEPSALSAMEDNLSTIVDKLSDAEDLEF